MLRGGTCVCNASQNMYKHVSSLEHAIPNSVKFRVSPGYLPNNCQFLNLEVTGDDFRDQWEHRDILAFSSPHTHLPLAAGFPHTTPCCHLSTASSNGDPAVLWSSIGQIWASLQWALHSRGDHGARPVTSSKCVWALLALVLVTSTLPPPCHRTWTTLLTSGCK